MGRQVTTSGGLRAYARHRGVTPRAVEKAIATGRLLTSVRRAGRRVVIDFALADAEWEQNSSPMHRRAAELAKAAAAPKPVSLFPPETFSVCRDLETVALVVGSGDDALVWPLAASTAIALAAALYAAATRPETDSDFR